MTNLQTAINEALHEWASKPETSLAAILEQRLQLYLTARFNALDARAEFVADVLSGRKEAPQFVEHKDLAAQLFAALAAARKE